jgi:hypothetical protein
MFRALLLLFICGPVLWSATLISVSSFCRIAQNGSVTVDNHFDSLLPQGLDAACPGVSFDVGYTGANASGIVYADYPGDSDAWPAIEVSFSAVNEFSALLSAPASDPTWVLIAGQRAVMEVRETYTLPQPPGTAQDLARLVPFIPDVLGHDWSCWYLEQCSGSWPKFHMSAPGVIRYGEPFEVVYTLDLLPVGLEIRGGPGIPGRDFGLVSYETGAPGTNTYSPRLTAIPIPEPSSILLSSAALLTAALARRRRVTRGQV